MQNQAKIMILINASLGVLYILYSLDLWNTVRIWAHDGSASEWSPLYVTYFNIKSPEPVHSQPYLYDRYNLPFILFCVILAVNIYFIIRLQRNKEAKQTFF